MHIYIYVVYIIHLGYILYTIIYIYIYIHIYNIMASGVVLELFRWLAIKTHLSISAAQEFKMRPI